MGKKLLVADDSLTIQKVIKLALSGDVYDIQTVSDGNDALQQISVFRPDAVLIDVGIPGRSAFEVKKAMNEDSDFRNIPVILMSSAFEKVDEAKVALLQFEGRLTKPFDPTHLRQALTQALSLREAYSPPAPVQDEPSLVFSKQSLTAAPPRSREVPPPVSIPTSMPREPARKVEPPRPVVAPTPIPTPKPEPAFRELPEEERTKTFNTFTNNLSLDLDEPAPLPSLAPNLVASPEIELPDLESFSIGSEESDIRHLTESTVRMSSLDEYDSWNIGENAKGAAPAIEIPGAKSLEADPFLSAHKMNFEFGEDGPKSDVQLNDLLPPKFDHTRPISDLAPTRTHLEFTNQRLGGFSPDQQSAPPITLEPFPAEASRSSYGSLPTLEEAVSARAPAAAPVIAQPAVAVAAPAPAPATRESVEAALNSEEMQSRMAELVRQQVEKSLELMAKKGLPDIAEKVIRQEIRRILESLS